jgi:hypothetical protein
MPRKKLGPQSKKLGPQTTGRRPQERRKKKKYEGPGFERKFPGPARPGNPVVVYEVKSGGMAGKKSGPPPKSGPTPHGMKRGGIATGCGKVMEDRRKVTKYF